MGLLDILLGWVLNFTPALGIMIISFLVSGIITLAMKFLTNQSLMKDLKGELKELQKQMKDLKNNPNKLSKVNSRFMETNMKYMSHSMRPTLFTFIPIIIIFGWLNSHIGYYPLLPETPFEVKAIFDETAEGEVTLSVPDGLKLLDGSVKEVSDRVEWSLQGDAGEYTIELDYGGETFNKEIIITNERKYAKVEESYGGGLFSSSEGLQKINIGNERIVPFSNIPLIKNIPWVSGWGWLGAYLFFSIIFSMSLRKVLKIY